MEDSGLPGALSSANLAAFNRRYSAYGDDHAKDTDYNLGAGFDQPTGDFGKFSFDTSLRRRQTFTDFFGWPFSDKFVQKNDNSDT